MGSPVSVIVANLVMEDVENRALSTYYSPPLFWKRYVDDICTAMEEYSIEEFQDHLNSIEPSIKFTSESESDGKLAFLDTEITHHEDGSMTTTVYRKKTHTDKYLSFDSHHPMAHKNAVARTLFKRAEVICSSLPERIAEELHITETLKENGYPHLSLQTTVELILNCLDHHRRKIKKQLLLCYHNYVGHVSESIKRLLAPLNIRTCSRPHKTLRELLVHPKDHIPDIKKKWCCL